MKLGAAIFDLDGVIVDTVMLHFKAWRKMFSEYGQNFTFSDYKTKVDGILRVDGAKNILGALPFDKIERAAARKQVYFLESLENKGVKTYKGTIDLIDELKTNNIKIGVISSSKNCRHILQKAKVIELFDVMVTGDDVKKGKPHPEVFITAAKKLGVSPERCIVFKDAALGIEGAKKAKMICVGIDRHSDSKRLRKADLVVSDLSEISLSTIEDLFQKDAL